MALPQPDVRPSFRSALRALAPVLPALLLMATSACSNTVTSGSEVPDFSLLDENTTSASYQQSISPRDFLGAGSAWYFGHAT